MKKVWMFMLMAIMLAVTMGCGIDDANVARYNLERSEQNFELSRRVIFYNGITNEHILTIEGKLAIIVDMDGDLVVTVKTDSGEYLKHYLGLSDNVTWFSEQLESAVASTMRYRVIFKPSSLMPEIDLR